MDLSRLNKEQREAAEELEQHGQVGQDIHAQKRPPLVCRQETLGIDAEGEAADAVKRRHGIDQRHQRPAGIAHLRRDRKRGVGEGVGGQQEQDHRVGHAV